MATLLIAEFSGVSSGAPGAALPVAELPELASQSVTFTTSTQSAALGATTRLVRLTASDDCHLAAGADPTASAASAVKLTAGNPEYFRVTPGHKIAAFAA